MKRLVLSWCFLMFLVNIIMAQLKTERLLFTKQQQEKTAKLFQFGQKHYLDLGNDGLIFCFGNVFDGKCPVLLVKFDAELSKTWQVSLDEYIKFPHEDTIVYPILRTIRS